MDRAAGGRSAAPVPAQEPTEAEVAAYLQSGGYRLLHDFSSHAGTGFFPPHCRPRMLRLTAQDLPPAAMSMASQMFNPPAARLGLTIAEQRVVLRALDGASDRMIAEALGLSTETVRSNWRSVYRRLDQVLAGMDSPAGAGGTYAQRLSEYSGEQLEVGRVQAQGEKNYVDSVIRRPNGAPPIRIVWEVEKRGSGYKVVDLKIEDVSMSQTQRSDFGSYVSQNGGKVDALIARMKQFNAR